MCELGVEAGEIGWFEDLAELVLMFSWLFGMRWEELRVEVRLDGCCFEI
jgi:hypothetical protein